MGLQKCSWVCLCVCVCVCVCVGVRACVRTCVCSGRGGEAILNALYMLYAINISVTSSLSSLSLSKDFVVGAFLNF